MPETLLLQPIFRSLARRSATDVRTYPLAAKFLRWKRKCDQAVTRRTADGFRMRLKLCEYPDGAMYLGIYEPGVIRLLRDIVRPGHVAIDAGANVGYITLHLSQCVGADGRVHSFEPLPSNVQRIEESLRENGFTNVELHPQAVGKNSGSVNFYSFPDQYGSWHALGSLQPLRENRVTIQSQQVRLDDVIQKKVQLIKIDVEGGEENVLAGAERILREHRPHVILENNPQAMAAFGGSLATLYRSVLALNLDYEALDIDEYQPKILNDDAILRGEQPNRQCNIWLRPKV